MFQDTVLLIAYEINWKAVKKKFNNKKIPKSLKDKYIWLFEFYNSKCESEKLNKYKLSDLLFEDIKNSEYE